MFICWNQGCTRPEGVTRSWAEAICQGRPLRTESILWPHCSVKSCLPVMTIQASIRVWSERENLLSQELVDRTPKIARILYNTQSQDVDVCFRDLETDCHWIIASVPAVARNKFWPLMPDEGLDHHLSPIIDEWLGRGFSLQIRWAGGTSFGWGYFHNKQTHLSAGVPSSSDLGENSSPVAVSLKFNLPTFVELPDAAELKSNSLSTTDFLQSKWKVITFGIFLLMISSVPKETSAIDPATVPVDADTKPFHVETHVNIQSPPPEINFSDTQFQKLSTEAFKLDVPARTESNFGPADFTSTTGKPSLTEDTFVFVLPEITNMTLSSRWSGRDRTPRSSTHNASSSGGSVAGETSSQSQVDQQSLPGQSIQTSVRKKSIFGTCEPSRTQGRTFDGRRTWLRCQRRRRFVQKCSPFNVFVQNWSASLQSITSWLQNRHINGKSWTNRVDI